MGLELGSGCIKSTIAVDDNAAAAATFAYVTDAASKPVLGLGVEKKMRVKVKEIKRAPE